MYVQYGKFMYVCMCVCNVCIVCMYVCVSCMHDKRTVCVSDAMYGCTVCTCPIVSYV